MSKEVTLTRTANGKYYKIISRGKGRPPVHTPLFEVGDTDRDPGREAAIAWAVSKGYTVK